VDDGNNGVVDVNDKRAIAASSALVSSIVDNDEFADARDVNIGIDVDTVDEEEATFAVDDGNDDRSLLR
jgi:hypothetical protein